MKLDAVGNQDFLNNGRQIHERMKWFWVLSPNPVRTVKLHVYDSGLPRVLGNDLAGGFGNVVRP